MSLFFENRNLVFSRVSCKSKKGPGFSKHEKRQKNTKSDDFHVFLEVKKSKLFSHAEPVFLFCKKVVKKSVRFCTPNGFGVPEKSSDLLLGKIKKGDHSTILGFFNFGLTRISHFWTIFVIFFAMNDPILVKYFCSPFGPVFGPLFSFFKGFVWFFGPLFLWFFLNRIKK